MLLRVPLVRTDVSEHLRASIIRVTKIDELGTTLIITSNRPRYEEIQTISSQPASIVVTANVHSSTIVVTLMLEALCSSETLVHRTAQGVKSQ
jgi:hypothetical protein